MSRLRIDFSILPLEKLLLALKTKLLALAFLAFSNALFCQKLDSFLVSPEIKNEPLEAIFSKIETAGGPRFLFAEGSLGSRLFDEKFEKKPLADALHELFKKTDLRFFFYRDQAVVVGPSAKLEGEFSADFYRALAEMNQKSTVAEPENAPQILQIGSPSAIAASGKARVRGRVVDAEKGQPVVGAPVGWKNLSNEKARSTDEKGRFEVILPVGRQTAMVQYLGFEPLEQVVEIFADGEIELKMTLRSQELAEVLVRPDAPDANLSSTKMSVAKINPLALKKLPTLMGETDVLRGLLTTTGVTSVGEGSAGINVRGGDVDQNLMLQDEVVLFNSSHALGFFSTYNADLVSSIELYKSIIPAQFGGRLASVLDVNLRDGNAEKWAVKGGLSLLSARLAVEGPVQKGRSTMLAGVRFSYSDWILKAMKRLELRRSSASFYDVNFRFTQRLNSTNWLTVSAYAASDEFNYARLFGFDYQTRGSQIALKTIFSDRLFSRFSVVGTRFRSRQTDFDGSDAGSFSSGIDYLKLREVLTYRPRKTMTILAGGEAILYNVSPGERQPGSAISAILPKILEKEKGLESALFGQMDWEKSKKLTISAGLRLNVFQRLGDSRAFEYGSVISEKTILDTLAFGKWETLRAFFSPEPRLSFRYRVSKTTAWKGGYSRTSQFINQIFNSDTPTPTSQFQLSGRHIRPFYAHNLAAGYFKNSRNNEWEYSGELFFRLIDKLWDYRDFANLTANEHIETEIRNGNGHAYGAEFFVKTTRKKVNGQLGYTFSRAKRRVDGVNSGRFYPSSFDKPHNLNLILNFLPSLRQNFTFNFTYSTGRPTTAPLNAYRFENNIIVPIYAPRNAVRIPDYHRLDVSWTVGKGYNKTKRLKTTWNVSVYNLYFRRNAFSVFYSQNLDTTPRANRLAIIGTAFPAVTVNFEM